MIQLRDITVRFGEKTVLERVSLTLPEPGILCLTGPSGQGKTTLARVLAGLQTPTSGAIHGLTGGVSMLFQEDRLLPWCSIRENVAAALPRRQAGEAERWLRAVELGDAMDAPPDTLSGGMCRRAALARALAAPGQLLILDEPFKGMDEALRERLLPLLRAQGESRAVLVITHELALARSLGQVAELRS